MVHPEVYRSGYCEAPMAHPEVRVLYGSHIIIVLMFHIYDIAHFPMPLLLSGILCLVKLDTFSQLLHLELL